MKSPVPAGAVWVTAPAGNDPLAATPGGHAAAVMSADVPVLGSGAEAARGSLAVATAKAFGSDVAAEVISDLFSLIGTPPPNRGQIRA